MVRRDALGLLALAPFAGAGMARAATVDTPYVIERSLVTNVTASDGHPYRLLLAWPEGSPPPGGWPALVVLDGADNFAIAVETARRLAGAASRSGVRPGLIAAIDSGPLARRVLDYTPPVPGYAIPEGKPAHGFAIGGADRFLNVLTGTILLRIAKRWPLDRSQVTFAGHSFGGLLALHALTRRTDPFTRFAAISPSLWFGDSFADTLLVRTADLRGTNLLLAESERAGRAEGTPFLALGRLAKALEVKGVAARLLGLGDLDHGSTMAGAMGSVVRLAFAEPKS